MGKSKEKKKKQSLEEEEENQSANVKNQKELNKIDVEIKAIDENPEKKSTPIIGYFPSAYDPLKNFEEPDSETGPSSSVKVYKNVNSRNPKTPRMQVVVGVSGTHVNFVGTNYSGEATTPQLCNYALGVLDKETRVLKMVPIAANRIFRLEPKVGGMEQPEDDLPDAAKESMDAEERADKVRNLTDMYSTKKNKRRDEKNKALRQMGDPGMEEDMGHKLKGIEINTEVLEGIDSGANARNTPPYDLEATAADMAYPLDKIILKGEWDYLGDIFELAQRGSELAPDVYPTFVCNRVQQLERIKDESKRRRMAGILTYITHLIKYNDKHSMDGVSSAKRHKLPSILSHRFSSLFGSTDNKRLPEDKQKLLVSYVLVLSLFVDDFRSNPLDIAKDLRMSPVTIRTHYEYLGCKYKRENQVLLATLPVPLEFQTIKRKRRRK